MRNRARERRDGTHTRRDDGEPVRVRRIPTLLVGIVGGLMVGLTSVGSGSLIIIALMLLYPLLPMGRLSSAPISCRPFRSWIAAAIGHLLFGEVDWSIVLPLIIGSVPGTIIGARLSSTLPSGIVRRALALVLLAFWAAHARRGHPVDDSRGLTRLRRRDARLDGPAVRLWNPARRTS